MKNEIRKTIEAERFLLREPNQGRVRARLETAAPRDEECQGIQGRVVRLTLLDPDGDAALIAEVDERGEATLHIGHPEKGTTITLTSSRIDLWHAGNIVGTFRSSGDGGKLDLRDADGRSPVSP